MMLNAATHTLRNLNEQRRKSYMEARLRADPLDREANEYFGNKIQEEQINEAYETMMREYPETLTRVLMLYVEMKINKQPVQAFVDSGAQTSVMSMACAERCNLLRLVDKRFAGKVVGVGTGETLGIIFNVPIEINGNFFPCSVTVMNDAKGLGVSF